MLFDLGWACARLTEAEDGAPLVVIFTPEGQTLTLDATAAQEGLQALAAHICSMEPVDATDAPTESLARSPRPHTLAPAEIPTLDPDDAVEPLTLSLSTSLLTQNLPAKKEVDFSDLDGL